ncbi:protein-arginine deiminase family protein [Myxococcaceae bacterium GXIMD 01537]
MVCLCLLLPVLGCEPAAEVTSPDGGTPDAGSPDAGVPPGDPIVDLRADVNRNGTVDLSDPSEDEGEEAWSAERGAIFLANLDDDLRRCPYSEDRDKLSDVEMARCHDAEDEVINGADDLVDLARLRTVPWPGAPASAVGTLSIPGSAAGWVRLFRNTPRGFEVFDPAKARVGAEELRTGVEWAIEAKDIVRDLSVWDGYVDVVLSVTWSGGPAEPLRDTVRMRVSPVMTLHHLNSARTVFVANLIGREQEKVESAAYQAGLDAARREAGVPNALSLYTNPTERWLQDFFESGYMAMPSPGGQHFIRVTFRTPYLYTSSTWRDSPLRLEGRLAFQLRGKDSATVQQYDMEAARSNTGVSQTRNSLGNLETIPPYEKDGVRYPLGRLFIGSTPSARPDPSFTRMLEAQGMQPPVYVDTSWLYVGHVDETFSFIPANTPRGWVALVADPRLARKMFEDARDSGHGDVKLFVGKFWGRDKQEASSETTVAQVLADTAVMEESAAAAEHIDKQLEVLRREVGLTDEDLIRVPYFFQKVKNQSAAYQPGTVNLLVLSRTMVVAPNPHGPVIDGKDILKDAFETALAARGVSVRWLDDWMLYHRYVGNVHCSTNVIREIPSARWWESGR